MSLRQILSVFSSGGLTLVAKPAKPDPPTVSREAVRIRDRIRQSVLPRVPPAVDEDVPIRQWHIPYHWDAINQQVSLLGDLHLAIVGPDPEVRA